MEKKLSRTIYLPTVWDNYVLEYMKKNDITSYSQAVILLFKESKIALEIKTVAYDATKALRE